MGLHADMEAQQVCEQLYQLIIVLVSVRDHTGSDARTPISRVAARRARGSCSTPCQVGAHANANMKRRHGFGRRRGALTRCSLLVYLSLCVRVCVRACMRRRLRQTHRLWVLWRATF
jgi:hypothetical protein